MDEAHGAQLRASLKAARAELKAMLLDEGRAPRADLGLALGRRNAKIYDDLLTALFRGLRSGDLASPSVAPVPAEAWEKVALVAVGSYGRGAVAFKSDIDVRFLARRTEDAALVAEAMLYPLWDMGVTIGHQVATVDDLYDGARDDLPTATTLLDLRLIAGDRSIVAALGQRAAEGIFAYSELPRFLARLEDEVKSRHDRFGGSVYLLEPDVKNGAGGLRDVDVARWAAKARYKVGEPEELVRVGALVPREATAIQEAQERLWVVRNLLHARADRRSDRLTFDEQEAIAVILGMGEGDDAVELFMSGYYRAARAISGALTTSLARAAPVLSRRKPRDEDLGGGARLFEGAVTVRDVELLRTEPALALRLVAEAVDRGVPLLPFARDAIGKLAGDEAWCAELRASREARARFLALVSSAREVRLASGSIVRELSDTGLLLAMIPEFLPVVGRVHHDTYHVYTVDVHSVAAVDRIATLVRGELASEFPLACRLAAEIVSPEVLFFATLLHDVGKAIGRSDHSVQGARMTRDILTRLGFSKDDAEEAAHLVLHHLLMYHVATRRDLEDPATIAELSRAVNDREGLRDLYLLTVADLSTTSPTSMTSWKARMLDELYLATDEALASAERDSAPTLPSRMLDAGRDSAFTGRSIEGGGASQRRARAAAEVEREALAGITDEADRAARRAFVASYLAGMPERYLLANAPAAIAAHADLAQRAGDAPATIALVPSRHPQAAEICVVAADRPGLLAAITAAIAASRLEVHAAEIHSRTLPNGAVQAVDLFWVRDRGDGVEGVARSVSKLGRDLSAVLAGEVAATDLARRRGGPARAERASPKVKRQIAIDDRASPRFTVIEVITRDRPGLLFELSSALYDLGLSIAVAKINTEGTRVADVFYVSEAGGGKIAIGKRSQAVEAKLAELLDGIEAEHSSKPPGSGKLRGPRERA